RRVRDRRLPSAVPDREVIPDGQERPAGPARLPPPARLHRSPPDHRLRRPGRQPLDRAPDRLVPPHIRQDPPPLPHHHHPGRPPRHHRRPPPARGPPASNRPTPRPTGNALTCHKSGQSVELTSPPLAMSSGIYQGEIYLESPGEGVLPDIW